MTTLTDIRIGALQEIKKLQSRGAHNSHKNENALRSNSVVDKCRETMSEREFVRSFGTKVKNVRYSGRADFVGLMILGNSIGFLVVRGSGGIRKLRVIQRSTTDNSAEMTNRYRPLKAEDSLSNLQRGLLAWVQ